MLNKYFALGGEKKLSVALARALSQIGVCFRKDEKNKTFLNRCGDTIFYVRDVLQKLPFGLLGFLPFDNMIKKIIL